MTGEYPVRMKPGRNDPCTCGSGKKYKKCCAELPATGSAGVRVLERPRVADEGQELQELAALAGAGRYAQAESRARALLLEGPDSGVLWRVLGLSLWMQTTGWPRSNSTVWSSGVTSSPSR